jgi:hypothetical protein
MRERQIFLASIALENPVPAAAGRILTWRRNSHRGSVLTCYHGSTMAYICDGSKYTFENYTIALPVTVSGAPSTYAGLIKKDTFHVSLVCIGQIADRLGVQIDESAVQKYFCEYIAQCDLVFLPGREWRRVAENENETLLLLCEIRGLDGFFDVLRVKIDARIENQPTHITVFTRIKNTGIWVIDASDLNKSVLESVDARVFVEEV